TGTVTFAAGETTKVVTLDPVADNTVEADETATLTVTSGTGYNIIGSPATGTITNDDVNVTLAVSPASIVEDAEGNLIYTFTRTMQQGVTDGALRVDFTVGGTASVQGGDFTYSATGGANGFDLQTGLAYVTFDPGADMVTFIVNPTADATAEPDETVALTLLSGTGYTPVTTGAVEGTILNDDTIVTLAVSPSPVTEGGATSLVYTFTRTGGADEPATTVNFSLGGTATLGADFTQSGATFEGAAGTVVIPQGSASATVTITILNDTLVEGNETTQLTLAAGAGYGVGTAGAVTGTIADNDTATLSFVAGSSLLSETATGFAVEVALVITADGVVNTGTLGRAININVEDLLTGSGTAGADYTFSSPSVLTFASGAANSSQQVNVTLTNDRLVEGTESIKLALNGLSSNLNGQITLGASAHEVTVTDDETATVGFAATSSPTGEAAGTHGVNVTLLIAGTGEGPLQLAKPVTVSISNPAGGTAVAGGVDYSFTSQVLTFAANSTDGAVQTANLAIVNDLVVEASETVLLTAALGT
ncbi:MAG: hypothetical protein EOP84_22920, partial [Verrucomicrobiaceae bacterium]